MHALRTYVRTWQTTCFATYLLIINRPNAQRDDSGLATHELGPLGLAGGKAAELLETHFLFRSENVPQIQRLADDAALRRVRHLDRLRGAPRRLPRAARRPPQTQGKRAMSRFFRIGSSLNIFGNTYP